jgi:hypothetical protein
MISAAVRSWGGAVGQKTAFDRVARHTNDWLSEGFFVVCQITGWVKAAETRGPFNRRFQVERRVHDGR